MKILALHHLPIAIAWPRCVLLFCTDPTLSRARRQCLNQCDDKHVINALKAGVREADESVLQSDADEQLLIYIPFRETVKIQTITIRSPPDGSGPCTVKVFKDVPNGAMVRRPRSFPASASVDYTRMLHCRRRRHGCARQR
eukprot:COSAG05_NODE_1695_length_4263_cov_9.673391_2_plen_141_part_00